jgi:hypothetical protein
VAETKKEASAKHERRNKLLYDAAQALEKGSDPFNHEWLVANQVTADECFGLSEQMSLIIKGFLGSSKDDQVKILAVGAVYGEPGFDVVAFREHFSNSLKMGSALKKLSALADAAKKKEK